MLNLLKSVFDIYSVLEILASVAMCLAINLDCRAKNIGNRKIYTVLAFFFPIIVGIVYCIKRKGEKSALKICASCGQIEPAQRRQCTKCGSLTLVEYKNPKAKKLNIISIILCVVACVSLVISSGASVYSQRDTIKQIVSGEYDEESKDQYEYEEPVVEQELMYDKNGIAYSDSWDIKFYDKNDKVYHKSYVCDDSYFVDEEENQYQNEQCFVDKDGIFYIDDKKTKLPEIKYPANEVYWDYTGTMYYLGEVVD